MTLDPSAVVQEGEVFINNLRYPLIDTRGVQKTVSSEQPPKFVQGDAIPSSHPLISSILWDNLQAGSGLPQITSPGDENRAAILDRMQPNVRGRLSTTSTKTATSTSGANGTPGPLAELNATIFASWTSSAATNVYRYDSTNDRWGNTAGTDTAAVVGLTQAATDAATGFVNSTEYMVFVTGTDMEWRPGNDTTWAGPDTTDITYVAFHDNRLWGIHTDGRFYMTTVLSTSSTSAGWVELGRLNIAGGAGLVTDLFPAPSPSAGEKLYAATETGLRIYDNQTETWETTAIKDFPYREHAGKGSHVNRGIIYYPSGFDVYPYLIADQAFVTEISPNKDGGTPVNRVGTIRKTISTFRETLAFSSSPGGNSTWQGSVYNWNQLGWYRGEETSQSIADLTEHAVVSNAYDSYRLWFSNSTNSTGGNVSWIPLPESVEPSYRGTLAPYQAGTTRVQLPNFDAGGSLQAKLALRFHTVIDTIDSTGTVTIRYLLNETDTTSLVTLGVADSTGSFVYNFPSSSAAPVGTDFNSIQFDILTQGSTATPTVIESMTFEYARRNPVLFGYDIPLDLSVRRWGDRGPRTMRTEIDALLTSTSMVELRYTNDPGTDERIYVLPRTVVSEDVTGTLPEGQVILRTTELIRLPNTNQDASPPGNDGFFLESSTTDFLLLEDGFFVLQES